MTPAQQVRRVMGAAQSAGAQRFALVAPDGAFGRALAAAMRAEASTWGVQEPVIVLHGARANPASVAQDLATRAPGGLDAVMLGSTGAAARAIAAALAPAGLANPAPRILGHALWAQDDSLGRSRLAGALFAAPDPRARATFDALMKARSASARRAWPASPMTRPASPRVVRPRGQAGPNTGEVFDGVDGPIRLQPNGIVQRGLALFSVEAMGEPRMVEAAPQPGGAGS